jgi:hypothetical protein
VWWGVLVGVVCGGVCAVLVGIGGGGVDMW